ncbi:WAP four-disulfide core domain protein 5-like [Haliotis cracherodii]|uniref:WAP four-disulfide core domain protein 5-like n=1 Tax=Haliotis cracherodii TaxID=6455 RepID=UPI0039ED0557
MVTWPTNFALGLVCHLTMMIDAERGCTQMCPSGTHCVRTAVTCINGSCTDRFICESADAASHSPSIERRSEGSCPTTLPGTSGPCVEQCRHDEDCRRGKTCCYNGCGHTCMRINRQRISSRLNKPGSCPWYARESLSCDVECLHDHGCPGRSKCCQTTCGSTCAQPCFHWLSNPSSSSRTWSLPRRCERPAS